MNPSSFHCNSSWGTNLCFQGACISVSPLASSCSCEPGWERDNYLYHSEGCTMPSIFPLICTILSFALLLGCFFLVFRKHFPQSKGATRQLLIFCLVCNVTIPVELLGLYLQKGFYEVCIVIVSISVVFVCFWADRLIGIVLKPLFQVQQKLGVRNDITIRVRVFLLLFSVYFIAVGLGQLITCRWEDNVTFNVMTDCMLILGTVFMTVTGTMFYFGLVRLENSLTRRQRQEMREEVKLVFVTLTSMRRQLILVMVGNALLCLPWVIMNRTLGSSPYSWIQTFLNTTNLQFTMVSVTHKLLSSASQRRKKPQDGLMPFNGKDGAKGEIATETLGSVQATSTSSLVLPGRMGDIKDPDAPDSTRTEQADKTQTLVDSGASGYFHLEDRRAR